MAAPAAKLPAHSLEAEQAVLGGLMLSEHGYDRIAGRISDADFYRADHQHLFRAITALASATQPCDAVMVAEWLQKHGLLEKCGGMSYIAELTNNTPGAANIVAHAEIIREKSVLRRLADVGNQIVDAVYQPEGRSSADILDIAEQKIFSIAEAGAKAGGDFQSLTTVMKETYRKIEERYSQKDDVTGLSSGFLDLDRMTAGLQPSDLIIVAARPSMGKTAFAMNIAENASLIEGGKPVAVFSMEMSADQIALRMLSSLARVRQDRLRTGRLEDEEWVKLPSTIRLMKNARMFIDDTPALSPMELRARARRLKRSEDLGLIVIDYLQLMQVPGSKENRATEISEISRSLKATAKELKVPVIALSQLNRSVEQRPDKRPMMSDLRESGSIEQDADVVMFIYRDEYYNRESPDKGLAQIIIAKQRNGPTGDFKLRFFGQYTRFDNFERMPTYLQGTP
jgi:replicative DNA helicase